MFNKKTVKNCWFLLLPALIGGCQTAATIKLSSAQAEAIKTVRIVPIEAPPLEVLPDLLEARMPNYAHDFNMVLPDTAEETVYRNPGGILIAGRVGQGDSVEPVDFSKKGNVSGHAQDWTPTLELSAAAQAQLDAAQIKSDLNEQVVLLPLADKKRTAYIGHWRDAVARWYEQNAATSVNQENAADAVLEVGIGRYRIFEGQTSLQVLLKLIDGRSGRVLAKTSRNTLVSGDVTTALLYPEGERFKTLIRQNGARLMAEAIHDIGLTSMRL